VQWGRYGRKIEKSDGGFVGRYEKKSGGIRTVSTLLRPRYGRGHRGKKSKHEHIGISIMRKDGVKNKGFRLTFERKKSYWYHERIFVGLGRTWVS